MELSRLAYCVLNTAKAFIFSVSSLRESNGDEGEAPEVLEEVAQALAREFTGPTLSNAILLLHRARKIKLELDKKDTNDDQ